MTTTYDNIDKTQALTQFADGQDPKSITAKDSRDAIGSLYDKFDDVFDNTRKGVVPVSSGSANEFLSADATFKQVAYSQVTGTPVLSDVALSNDYLDLDNLPALSAVALSNDYLDLNNTPVIANNSEAIAGSNNTALMTPLRVKEAFDEFLPDNLPYIQQPEGIFPIESEVVSINPTRLESTPYSPIFTAPGAVVGECLNAVYEIATDTAFSNIVHTITRTSAPFDQVQYNIGLLAENTTHYWRVRYTDTKGNVSPWSETSTFVTAESYLFDMLAIDMPSTSGNPYRLQVYDVDVATYTLQDIIAEEDKITTGAVYCNEWTASGRHLLVGGNSGTGHLNIYDYGDGIPVKVPLPEWLQTKLVSLNNVYIVRVNKAENKIFIGGSSGGQYAILAEWNNETGIGEEIILPSSGLTTAVFDADFSHDNNYLVFTTTGNSGTSPANSYIHVYAFVNSLQEPIANPVRLTNPASQPAANHYGVVFDPKYNRFFVVNSSQSTGAGCRFWNIAANNTISYIGELSNSLVIAYSLVCNPEGTRLYIATNESSLALLRYYDIDQVSPTTTPSYLGVISNAQLGSAFGGFNTSWTVYAQGLSIDPTGNYLAVTARSVPNGIRACVADISNDGFTAVDNIPFAFFPDTNTFSSNTVAYRFGRYGYPAEV